MLESDDEGPAASTTGGHDTGYVYVLTHQYMAILKIGVTSRPVEQRALELYTTGVPTPFSIAYERKINGPRRVEAKVHEALSACRVNAGREFFSCSVGDAIRAIEQVCGKPKVGLDPRLEHRCPLCLHRFPIPYDRRRDVYLRCPRCKSQFGNPRWDSLG